MLGNVRAESHGYSNRRKRNIEIKSNYEHISGINWAGENEADEITLDEDNNNECFEEEIIDDNDAELMLIGNKKVNIDKLNRKKHQNTEKLTIYLESNLISILKALKVEKKINSYSALISEALISYLTT